MAQFAKQSRFRLNWVEADDAAKPDIGQHDRRQREWSVG